jgi:hypothetical protein
MTFTGMPAPSAMVACVAKIVKANSAKSGAFHFEFESLRYAVGV